MINSQTSKKLSVISRLKQWTLAGGPTNKAPNTILKAATASLVGTAIGWYDFFIYNAATGIVFGPLFFNDKDPITGVLKAFGVYAVGFAARPLGGVICGHLGDKIGRKTTLVLTLILTGGSTFMIGLLPSFESIGVAAPILLIALRMVQGFGIGGEWGGAVLVAVEQSPRLRRGFYGSWPQVGGPIGMFLATAVFGLVSLLPESALMSWGWRIPFLLSILLVAFGLYIRLKIDESQLFIEVLQANKELRRPVLGALRLHPRNVAIALGSRLVENGSYYLYTAFIVVFATRTEIGFSRFEVLFAVSLAALIAVVAIPCFGLLSDIVGRRPVYLGGAVFTAMFAFPFFRMVETRNVTFMTLAIVGALVLGHSAMYGPQASFFAEMFSTEVRYSGASLGSQIASVFAGGVTPLVATALMTSTDRSWPISLLIIGMAFVSIVSVLLARETVNKDISGKPGSPLTNLPHLNVVADNSVDSLKPAA